jgi:hypothetical protein
MLPPPIFWCGRASLRMRLFRSIDKPVQPVADIVHCGLSVCKALH